MPSQLHEVLLLLFRNRPELAPSLLREALHVDLPPYAEARIESADLTDVQPAEYRADLVVLLRDEVPVLGIVVEVQLSVDDRKQYAWPVYAVGLRARMRCPVCLLVVTAQESVAKWAAQRIELGGDSWFTPLVIRPSGVPEITDEERAAREPELAVLSAMSHGRSADSATAVRIGSAALAASQRLDSDRSVLYSDLVYAALGEAARASLNAMDIEKYEFQTEFGKRWARERAELRAVQAESALLKEALAENKEALDEQKEALDEQKKTLDKLRNEQTEAVAEARAEGLVSALSKVLTHKFGALDEQVTQRLRAASTAEVDSWLERVLDAATIDDVFR